MSKNEILKGVMNALVNEAQIVGTLLPKRKLRSFTTTIHVETIMDVQNIINAET